MSEQLPKIGRVQGGIVQRFSLGRMLQSGLHFDDEQAFPLKPPNCHVLSIWNEKNW
jgi:hypothetical protein